MAGSPSPVYLCLEKPMISARSRKHCRQMSRPYWVRGKQGRCQLGHDHDCGMTRAGSPCGSDRPGGSRHGCCGAVQSGVSMKHSGRAGACGVTGIATPRCYALVQDSTTHHWREPLP